MTHLPSSGLATRDCAHPLPSCCSLALCLQLPPLSLSLSPLSPCRPLSPVSRRSSIRRRMRSFTHFCCRLRENKSAVQDLTLFGYRMRMFLPSGAAYGVAADDAPIAHHRQSRSIQLAALQDASQGERICRWMLRCHAQWTLQSIQTSGTQQQR